MIDLKMKYICFMFVFLDIFCVYGQTSTFYDNYNMASKGDAVAQYNIGVFYDEGREGVLKDYAQAVYWYKKSAEQGYASAQYNLGICYANGHGVAQDYNQALYWYKKSAEQGDAHAQHNLGIYYYKGTGVAQDYYQAVYWFKKSAEQGDARPQYALGTCYYYGNGVAQDYNQALYWYKKSAEQGDAWPQYALGTCYYYGNGVAQDYNQAVYWYKMSAEQGNAVAQYALGGCYYEGNGVAQDYYQAKYWYHRAGEQGDKRAINLEAYCYAKDKNFVMAHNTIDKLIQQEPNETNWLDSKGEFYIMQKEYLKARDIWNKIIKIKPDFDKERTNLYIALFENDNIDFDVPKSKVTTNNTFAIIIANENYKQEENVTYAGNDGEVVYKYFTQTLGIPEKQIKYVKDASLNDIKYSLNWLNQIADAYNGEAKALVYYAGHGIPDEANKDAYLLPSDGYGSDVSTGYKVSDLYSKLGTMPLKSTVVFMDACFSGNVRGEKMLASSRGVAIKANPTEPKGNMVVISAAQGDEAAYPYQEAGHGMFTYYLLKKLHDTNGDVSLGELSSYITQEVKKQSIVQNGKMQTPTVSVSPAMESKWRDLTLR